MIEFQSPSPRATLLVHLTINQEPDSIIHTSHQPGTSLSRSTTEPLRHTRPVYSRTHRPLEITTSLLEQRSILSVFTRRSSPLPVPAPRTVTFSTSKRVGIQSSSFPPPTSHHPPHFLRHPDMTHLDLEHSQVACVNLVEST